MGVQRLKSYIYFGKRRMTYAEIGELLEVSSRTARRTIWGFSSSIWAARQISQIIYEVSGESLVLIRINYF